MCWACGAVVLHVCSLLEFRSTDERPTRSESLDAASMVGSARPRRRFGQAMSDTTSSATFLRAVGVPIAPCLLPNGRALVWLIAP